MILDTIPVRINESYSTNLNDATIVKQLHMWGKKNNIPTTSVHDAFISNIADMVQVRKALREIYAKSMRNNVLLLTLKEMKARGLPQELYDKYLNEAIDEGLIPIAGRSSINGKIMKDSDILTKEDILKEIKEDFTDDYTFYGVN